MLDGSVRSLCPTDGESVKSLNFKRGILSMIQSRFEGNIFAKKILQKTLFQKISKRKTECCFANYFFVN